MGKQQGSKQSPTNQPADESEKASLADNEATGEPIALAGFDFQRAYALVLLVESLEKRDFSALMVEGAEM